MHRTTIHDIYTWSYLVSCRFSRCCRKTVRLAAMMRKRSPCDWVGSSIWGSPIVPVAPPRKHDHRLALNIDTYLTYVDKKIGTSHAITCNYAS